MKSFINFAVILLIVVLLAFSLWIVSIERERLGFVRGLPLLDAKEYGPPKPSSTVIYAYQNGTAVYSDGTVGRNYGN